MRTIKPLIMKVVFLLWSLLFFSSCFTTIPLKETPADNNQTFEISYLFEHEGCKVYRFNDRGNCVYFTNCEGNVRTYNDTMMINQNMIHKNN